MTRKEKLIKLIKETEFPNQMLDDMIHGIEACRKVSIIENSMLMSQKEKAEKIYKVGEELATKDYKITPEKWKTIFQEESEKMKNQEETNRSYFVLPDGGYAQAKDCLLVTVPESLDAEIDTVVNLLTDDNDPDTEDEVAQKLDEYKGCGLVVSRYGGFKGDFLTKEGEN